MTQDIPEEDLYLWFERFLRYVAASPGFHGVLVHAGMQHSDRFNENYEPKLIVSLLEKKLVEGIEWPALKQGVKLLSLQV